jgi:hypothetical protein
MPLDTNIALGVRPVEQPNMLAQMGQMMQLRGAQQQYEQQNNLRDAFAQGTDINDPATFDRIARQDPRLALELRGKNFDQQQKQTEMGLKRADYLGAAYSGLVKNPTVDNAYSIFDNAVQMGIIPSQAAAAMRAKIAATGGDPRQIAALAQQGIDAATSAQAKLQAQVTREGHGVTMRGQDLVDARARETHAREQANYPLHFFTAPDGTLMSTSTRGGSAGASAVPMAGSNTPPPQVTIGGGGGGGAGSSIMVNPSPINNLAPVNQNALITQPQPTFAPAAPAYAQVRSTPVTKDIVDPTDPTGRRMITVEVNNYKAGTGLGADGKQAAPAGVLGVATSQIPPNYMRDPKNPDGLIPVPGSAADPRAAVPSGYQPKADGNGFEPIPGGPADPTTTAPSGYRRTASGDLEYIPGGTADPKTAAPPAGYRKTADGNLEFIPGSAADPSTVVPSGYRKTTTGFEPIPGGPQDPKAATPSGYQRTPAGNLTFIPGGPQDPTVQAKQTSVKLDEKTIAARNAAYPQATLAVKSGEQNTTSLIKQVNDLHDHKGLSGITGFFGGRTTNLSGPARSAQADLKKIVAEGTLKVLTDLRAASKTGGALGNTSNKDIDLLQNAAAALDQTQNTEDFKRKLKDFAFVLERTKQNMREAYDMTYEYKTQATGGFTYLGKE